MPIGDAASTTSDRRVSTPAPVTPAPVTPPPGPAALPAPLPVAPTPTEAEYAAAGAWNRQCTVAGQLGLFWAALPRCALTRLTRAGVTLTLLLALLVLSPRLATTAWAHGQATFAAWQRAAIPSVTAPATPTPVAAATADCGTLRVTAARVRLRQAPGLRSAIVRKLARDEVVTLLCDAPQRSDGYVWQRVQGRSDSAPGWVAQPYLSPVP
jgi:hypothetical protein